MSQASQPPAATHSLEQLLKMGADAARNGNRPAARSLFLALSREHPQDVRVWIGLAGVAASRNEQREALERVVALDPGNERARVALGRLAAPAGDPAAPHVTAVLPETIAPSPRPAEPPAPDRPARDEEPAPHRAPFPLMNAIAMGLILLLLAAVGVVLGRNMLGGAGTAAQASATPALAVQPPAPQATQAPAPSAPPAATAAPTAAAAAAPSPQATAAPPPATSASPAPTAQAAVTAAPAPGDALALPMGTPLDVDGWTAVLVRPDYAVALDGAIGDLRPAGRFVLAVVAVSNNSATPRVIPPDLFRLVDGAERSYTPVPGASTAYLSLYERAQRGDLALEDTFEPVVGLRSVPLIFDVPPDASGLRLTLNGAGPAGWPIDGAPPASSPSGP